MKTKIYITLVLFASLMNVEAQIGVYTEKPSQLFHIDAAKNNNNSSPTATTMLDDVVITSDGNFGIGTNTPSAKLHLNGSMMIQDGTQSNGHVLVSINNEGLAQWQQKKINKTAEFKISVASFTAELGVVGQLSGTTTLSNDEIGLSKSASALIIPKGRYMIIINGDVSGIPEYGTLIVKTSNGSTYYSNTYSEWLAQATFMLDITDSAYSDPETITFYFTPISTKVGTTSYYTEPPYTYPVWYTLSILQL